LRSVNRATGISVATGKVMDYEKIRKLDGATVEASKKIKVLSTLSWPVGASDKFLATWRKGNPVLPEIAITPPKAEQDVADLDAIVNACDLQNPAEKFIAETARSYANAGRMLMHAGTPDFTKYSVKIYGRPDTKYKMQDVTAVDGAQFFLDITENLLGHSLIENTRFDIPAEDIANWLRKKTDRFFVHDKVEVTVDPGVSAKALAGATRIRVRGGAFFSALDKDQLLFHEAMVHTATQLNGRKQSNLQCLGLGAPRTTRTQEGMAVLAELVTNSIDLQRLQRIALRVIAVKMALDGADFIELFKFFLEAGQNEIESVKSTQRIFRGGAVKGGVVFTKDAVYLQGLLEVHSFLRVAIRDNHPQMVSNLFAGRLTLGDAIRLNELFESGWLKPPTYIPTWASDLRRLAAMMAFSGFLSNIKLDLINFDRVLELEEDTMTSAG